MKATVGIEVTFWESLDGAVVGLFPTSEEGDEQPDHPSAQNVPTTLSVPASALGYSGDYRNGVRIAGVKFILDGSPQGRTAWLTEPYRERPPGTPADYRAYPTIDPDFYRRRAAELIRAGIPFIDPFGAFASSQAKRGKPVRASR